MKTDLISLLQGVKKHHLWFVSVILAVILTLPIVSGLEFMLENKVTRNYLITGLITALIVASIISGLIIYFLQSVTKLKQNNQLLHAVIDGCPVPMAINDGHGRVLNLNPEFIKRFGYTLEDIPTVDAWWPKAYPDEGYRQQVKDAWNERINNFLHTNNEFEPLEVRVYCKNNVYKTVMATATPLGDAFKEIFLVVLYDLSEKAKMVDALVESHNILQSIIETIPMRVFWKDKNSRYLGSNTAFAKDAGKNHPNDIIGKLDQDLAWKTEAERYQADDNEVIRDGKAKIAFEEPQTTPAGKQIILRTSKVPLRSSTDQVIGILGVYEDITDRKKSENELWLMKSIIDKSESSYFLLSPQGKVLFINDFACQILGYSKAELLEMYPWDFDPDFPAEAWQATWNNLTVKKTASIETRHQSKNGAIFNVEVTAHYISTEGSEYSFCIVKDITERKKIDAELRIAATAFESQEGMIITDANSNILKINHSFTKITGFTSEEALGRKMNLLKSGVHSANFYRDMWDSIKTTGAWQGEIWNRRKNGEIYPEWLTITAVKDADENTTHYVGTMIDITARKAIEERVHHMAHYDVLTDLPNRALLTDRLHQAIAQVRRDQSKLALIFLDLDNFKPVNDSLGHDIGDLLLKDVALRLQACVKRETDTLARIGGDEFVIVLSQIEETRDAAAVADKIIQSLTQPFEINQHIIDISCSLGIAVYPTDGMDVHSLMRIADHAMYEAKRAGRGCFRFYTPDASENPSAISPSTDNLI